MSNSTQQGTWSAPAQGITGGYTGDSLVLKTFIASLFGLSVYNAIELNVLVLVTFTKYSGVYFWSMLIASWGIIPYGLGFLLKFFEVTVGPTRWGSVVLLTIGWYAMVTGQSVVLWSRLHLLVDHGKVLRWTKWMIIIDAIVLHIPTTVLTFGSNGDMNLHTFVTAYNAYEKVQMLGFFIQELILSGIYIYETIRILRTSLQSNARKFMYQLFVINIIIIAMDIALVGVEFANLYIIETILKGVIYSIKLKLEFVVLGKLVQFVTASPNSIDDGKPRQPSNARRKYSYALGREFSKDEEIPDFVDPQKRDQDFTHATPPGNGRKNSRPYITDSELSLALFEHVESATSEPEPCHLEPDPHERPRADSSALVGDGDVLQEYHRASADLAGNLRARK